MIVVTGGAGFIGSAIAQELNVRGRKDIITIDDVDHLEKAKNIASIKYKELRGKDFFFKEDSKSRNRFNRDDNSHGRLFFYDRNR